MIKAHFSITEQREVSQSRFSKVQGVAVVENETGNNIVKATKKLQSV
jgi:hypothetical protein